MSCRGWTPWPHSQGLGGFTTKGWLSAGAISIPCCPRGLGLPNPEALVPKAVGGQIEVAWGGPPGHGAQCIRDTAKRLVSNRQGGQGPPGQDGDGFQGWRLTHLLPPDPNWGAECAQGSRTPLSSLPWIRPVWSEIHSRPGSSRVEATARLAQAAQQGKPRYP